MRKLLLFLLFTILVSVPVVAQDTGTIVEVAADNPDFSTLVTAAQTAGLVDALSGEGPFTVFAPDNAAFEAALAELGMTTNELLADTETLTDILLYHVVEGELTAADLTELAQANGGTTTLTTLQGSTINVNVTEDGVFLNGNPVTDERGVAVTETDNAASNGVIHVIDFVLLPPGEDMVETANIRVAHLSPDAPPVDVYVNGELSGIPTLAFGSISGWVEVPVGTYDIAVTPQDEGLDSAVIGPVSLSFAADSWTTIAAVGLFEAGNLTAQLVFEDFNTPLAEDQARVTLFHAIPGAPAVDVTAGDLTLVENLTFPGEAGDNDGAFVLDVPAGTYNINIAPAGSPDETLLELPEVMIEGRTFYFVAAAGTLENPQVVIETVTVAGLEGEMMESEAGTIVEVASGSEDFSTLVAAVEAAGLVDTLSGEGPFTVFAPTNAAFEAALAELGMTTDELLADTEMLTRILTYHVVPQRLPAAELVALDSVSTVEDSTISVSVTDAGVRLNDSALVAKPDIIASNGVIHAIDAVLLPPDA